MLSPPLSAPRGPLQSRVNSQWKSTSQSLSRIGWPLFCPKRVALYGPNSTSCSYSVISSRLRTRKRNLAVNPLKASSLESAPLSRSSLTRRASSLIVSIKSIAPTSRAAWQDSARRSRRGRSRLASFPQIASWSFDAHFLSASSALQISRSTGPSSTVRGGGPSLPDITRSFLGTVPASNARRG